MPKRLHSNLSMILTAGVLIFQAFAGEAPDFVILARTDVPNRMLPQAEIRMIRRGPERVVQSAILPRFPNKVMQKITTSEQKNWPGNPNADTYVATLKEAFKVYQEQHDRKTTALVIDFVSSTNSTRVDFCFAPATRNDSGILLQPATVWESLDLSPDYVKKNQEYILIDAFGKEASEHIKTLRSNLDTANENSNSTP